MQRQARGQLERAAHPLLLARVLQVRAERARVQEEADEVQRRVRPQHDAEARARLAQPAVRERLVRKRRRALHPEGSELLCSVLRCVAKVKSSQVK